MLRLIGFLFMITVTAGGYVYFDYKMSARWAGKADADGLSFSEYLSGLSGRLAGLSGSASAAGLPSKLAAMLPTPPEGWTVRPVEADDIKGFLPKDKKADKTAIATLKAMVEAESGRGTEVAALTYEKGDRKLIIKAVRYPNVIFTSAAAMEQRLELQATKAQFRGTEFMTVRGLDVTEDLLPEGFRARYFMANVGGQIHLRVLAPRRMADEDLVRFFETLHVKAMNADVIDKTYGLGDVPVIVLASALNEADRATYLADRAARAADAAAKQAEARAALEIAMAAQSAEEETGGGFLANLFGSADAADAAEVSAEAAKASCTTGKDGVKRCAVAGAAPAAD